MILKETPHIKLRNSKGHVYIDYTACDILENPAGVIAARSYSTIIGIYTSSSSGQKVYYKNCYGYSTTTSTKHHPRAERLAAYNGYQIQEGINPKTLHNLYFNPAQVNIKELEEELKNRREIEDAAYNNNFYLLYQHQKKDNIRPEPPESIQYKNGNRLVRQEYKTRFKYIQNISFTEYSKTGPKTIEGGYYRNGYKPARIYRETIYHDIKKIRRL